MQVWPAAQLLWYAFTQREQQPKSESASKAFRHLPQKVKSSSSSPLSSPTSSSLHITVGVTAAGLPGSGTLLVVLVEEVVVILLAREELTLGRLETVGGEGGEEWQVPSICPCPGNRAVVATVSLVSVAAAVTTASAFTFLAKAAWCAAARLLFLAWRAGPRRGAQRP